MPKITTNPSLASRIFIGIDPGANGGIAAISCVTGKSLLVEPLPGNEVDRWELFVRVANLCRNGGGGLAILEKVVGYQPNSKGNIGSRMFEFGRNYGTCRMGLIASGIPWEEVMARKWQSAFSLSPRKSEGETRTKWKNRLKEKAQQLFPGLKVTLATADALLIAEYGRRLALGQIKV